jgi:hypothetical protein
MNREMTELNKDVGCNAAPVPDKNNPTVSKQQSLHDKALSSPATATFGNVVRGWWLYLLVSLGLGMSFYLLGVVVHENMPVFDWAEVNLLDIGALLSGLPHSAWAAFSMLYVIVVYLLALFGFLAASMAFSHLFMVCIHWRKGCKDCGFAGDTHALQYYGSLGSKAFNNTLLALALIGAMYHIHALYIVAALALVFVLESRYMKHVEETIGGFIAEKCYDCERCEPYDDDDPF